MKTLLQRSAIMFDCGEPYMVEHWTTPVRTKTIVKLVAGELTSLIRLRVVVNGDSPCVPS